MARAQALHSFPWNRSLFLATGALCVISLLALFSASSVFHPALVSHQALWIGLGLLASLAVASMPYTKWMDVSAFLYFLAVMLLLVVEVAGTVKLGAARWITLFGLSVQPSELAKLATACVLARYLANHPAPLSLRTLMISALLAGVPALLVFAQPDLGSSSVIAAIWLGMVWIAGLSRRHLLTMMGAGLACAPIGWHVLKDYQRARLAVFMNPHADPLGAGYTIIQSQIAIGSGQIVGRGWLSGTQNYLNFLPERHTDFLFSVIGEEWGLLGSVVVVALFVCLLVTGIRIALSNSDSQGRLLAMGLVSWIAYQAVINLGMVSGLLPTVGVPLPLVSYGGSAVMVAWIAVGLLQSIERHGTRF